MELALNDPAVQSALIQAGAAVFSTVTAAVCAALIGKRFSDRKRLETKLELSQKDIEFLLYAPTEITPDYPLMAGSALHYSGSSNYYGLG